MNHTKKTKLMWLFFFWQRNYNFRTVILIVNFSIASPIELRCSNFDVGKLREIAYQCGKELTCFFENIQADNETQFSYVQDRYTLAYKCLGFVNSTLSILPIDLFKRYPNIEVFYGNNLGLKSISRSFFESANKLLDLYLSGNNITQLENFLFYGAINLRRVFLGNNQISEIGPDTFKKMILKQMLPYENVFQKKLEEIDLGNNQLVNLDYTTFSQLPALKILNLNHNNVKLKYGLFPLCLKKLDLSYNQLSDFSLRQLLGAPVLEDLQLNGNVFTNGDPEFLFPQFIFQLVNLNRLEISNCFTCSQLADVMIYFKKIGRTMVLQFDNEIIDASNIFGIACTDVPK